MFRRRQVAQNEIVAYHMRKFFMILKDQQRPYPEMVARAYGQYLWDGRVESLAEERELSRSRSRFYIALSIDKDRNKLEQLTKHATLISDRLLLSHNRAGQYYEIGTKSDLLQRQPTKYELLHPLLTRYRLDSKNGTYKIYSEYSPTSHESYYQYSTKYMYGIYCPNLAELGKWILDAEQLLKSGLTWYLPTYSIFEYEIPTFIRQDRRYGKQEYEFEDIGIAGKIKAIDYLIRDGRAVDASGAEPIKSQLVRPVLRIDLPFIEGVNLREFSKITIEEFTSYSAFRDFLRQSFLDMDTALNAVQSDRELLKLSLQIKDQIRSVRSEMETARRKRAVGVTGAVIGSVGAILVAVYGPALEAAIATIGATGGVWGIIHAATENSTRALREDKWYYVWALAKKSNIHVL
jgi:hypothetical protein